jgi:hypothetical protein
VVVQALPPVALMVPEVPALLAVPAAAGMPFPSETVIIAPKRQELMHKPQRIQAVSSIR